MNMNDVCGGVVVVVFSPQRSEVQIRRLVHRAEGEQISSQSRFVYMALSFLKVRCIINVLL